MATGYEIRHSLLNEAREMLYEKWRFDCDVLRRNADLTKQPFCDLSGFPPPPNAAEIKALAEDLYEFVQRK